MAIRHAVHVRIISVIEFTTFLTCEGTRRVKDSRIIQGGIRNGIWNGMRGVCEGLVCNITVEIGIKIQQVGRTSNSIVLLPVVFPWADQWNQVHEHG